MSLAAKTRGIPWNLVKLLVSAAVLVWLTQATDWSTILKILAGAQIDYFIGAFLVVGTTIILGAWRWKLLLHSQGLDFSLRFICSVSIISLFFNNFLPGSAGGDIVKAGYIIPRAPLRRSGALVSIIVDRALGLWAMLGFALVGISAQPPTLMDHVVRTRVSLGAGCAMALITFMFVIIPLLPFSRVPPRYRPIWHRVPANQAIENVLNALRQFLLKPCAFIPALGLTVAAHILTFTGGWLLAQSLSMPLNFLTAAVTFSLVITITTLPISFGGHGVRETAFVVIMTGYGMADKESAIALSLLLFGLQLSWGLLGGLAYAFGETSKGLSPAP